MLQAKGAKVGVGSLSSSRCCRFRDSWVEGSQRGFYPLQQEEMHGGKEEVRPRLALSSIPGKGEYLWVLRNPQGEAFVKGRNVAAFQLREAFEPAGDGIQRWG
jgi:hypothetical protein